MIKRLRSWEGFLHAVLFVIIVVSAVVSPEFLSVSNQVDVFQLSIEKVIVALMMSVEALLTMPLWISVFLFSTLSGAMVLGLLQRAKGIFIGLIWQTQASEAISTAALSTAD